jgi:hypothetical protein
MKKHLIVIGMVVLLLAVGLSGCVNQSSKNDVNEEDKEVVVLLTDEEKIIGMWEVDISGRKYQYTFCSDGTLIRTNALEGDSWSYWFEDEEIVYRMETQKGEVMIFSYEYKFEGNNLLRTRFTPDSSWRSFRRIT